MADDNVTEFNGVTKLDLPSERILKAAIENKITDVLILGYDARGELYIAGASADKTLALWLMEKAKKFLLEDF